MSNGLAIDSEVAQFAVLGGKFLGGGGGGSDAEGLKTANAALSRGVLRLVPLNELSRDDIVITASIVGAPSSQESSVTIENIQEAYWLFRKVSGEKPVGIISNENGGAATVNGWLLAAVEGLKVIDAPCNGRAHPTATMGSIGLDSKKNFRSWHVAIGGNPELGQDLKLIVYGSILSTSYLIRQASIKAGGLVAVVRNAVKAEYLEKHAAVGGISQAISIGEVIHSNYGNYRNIISGLQKVLTVKEVIKGEVLGLQIDSCSGYDVGRFAIVTKNLRVYVTILNEFMTVEDNVNGRLATFPDLINVISVSSGTIKTSAELEEGEEVGLVIVPKGCLKLGAGMFGKDLFREVEKVIDKDLVSYHF